MNLNDMLFAYGKGENNRTKAKLDLKRSELNKSLNETVLFGEAEFLESERIKTERIVQNFGLGRQRTRQNTLRDRARYQEQLTESLLISSLFDIFNESLLLDEDFKTTYRGNLYNLTEQTFKGMIKEKGITIRDLKRESSAIMVEIIEICEAYAEKAAKEAYPLNEAKKYSHQSNDQKPIEVDLGLDGDFYAEKEFASHNIATLVKSKVVQVISDEKKYAEKQEEFKLEIDDKLDPTDGIDDEEILNDEEDMNDEVNEPTEKEAEDNIQEGFKFRSIKRNRKLTENTLFNALTLSIAKKNTMELKNQSENGNIELDMNLVFAESIAHYTLLETMYTTKLLNVTAKEAKTLVSSLLI